MNLSRLLKELLKMEGNGVCGDEYMVKEPIGCIWVQQIHKFGCAVIYERCSGA
jgi:hypothetical protein